MERLTKYNATGVAVLKQPFVCDKCDEIFYRLHDLGYGEPIAKLAKYEDLEEKLHYLCKNGDENIVENIINVFIEIIFKGQKHEGFEILTNEDAELYNEWLKTI
ncbi:MAG: hypothetical protein K0R54_2748 [Clostridiaceae bacterium]|jgi:hypothetical protein|nr:hypothetical protein [Clostridiaceae bacterium]MDF2950466.1 hypothetical protein [Anaerocolumna sp.]